MRIYPLAEHSEFVQRTALKPEQCDHRWTGNDASNKESSDRIPLGTTTLYLWWKASPDSTPDEIEHIGAFRLDLDKLLEGGYVREEKGEPGKVRLRFCHAPDNVVYIQTRKGEPCIPIGKFPQEQPMTTKEFIDVLRTEFKPGDEIAFGILLDNGGVYPIKHCSITETDNGKVLTFNLSNGLLGMIAMEVIAKAK
jgi:hypothetical protein